MSGRWKSLVYAGVLCVVCGLLLTAASSGLKPYQARNILIDRHRNILAAGGLLPEAGSVSAKDIEALYDRHIRPLRVDALGRILASSEPADAALPIYLFVEGQQVQGYIVPIHSRGLWGPIQAYLALDKDGATVKGFTVYQHAETPGLGGEIERKWFRNNWVGKKIVTRQGKFVSVRIAKGRVEDIVPKDQREHYVDGISGATLTGSYLAAGIEETLKKYEPVAVSFRKNLLHELAPAAAPR